MYHYRRTQSQDVGFRDATCNFCGKSSKMRLTRSKMVDFFFIIIIPIPLWRTFYEIHCNNCAHIMEIDIKTGEIFN
jgi:acetone carboxylase gamma subunit